MPIVELTKKKEDRCRSYFVHNLISHFTPKTINIIGIKYITNVAPSATSTINTNVINISNKVIIMCSFHNSPCKTYEI